MSEEIDQQKIREETKKWIEKQKRENAENKESESKGVSVVIDTKNVESLIERLKEKELENKQLHEKLEGKNPTKEEFEAESETEDKILKVIGKMRKELNEENLNEAEKEGLGVKFGERGSAGEIPLTQEQIEHEKNPYGSSGQKSWESHEAMISDLREMSHSSDLQEANYAKDILDKLMTKTCRAIASQGVSQPINYEDKPEVLRKINEGYAQVKTVLTKTLEKANKDWRRKFGYKEKDE